MPYAVDDMLVARAFYRLACYASGAYVATPAAVAAKMSLMLSCYVYYDAREAPARADIDAMPRCLLRASARLAAKRRILLPPRRRGYRMVDDEWLIRHDDAADAAGIVYAAPRRERVVSARRYARAIVVLMRCCCASCAALAMLKISYVIVEQGTTIIG